MRSVRARVTGRVQGVGYRAWAAGTARGLGLDGWIRNLPDGTVEALIAGEARAVERMLAEMARGPAFARVRSVESEDEPAPEASGFHILR